MAPNPRRSCSKLPVPRNQRALRLGGRLAAQGDLADEHRQHRDSTAAAVDHGNTLDVAPAIASTTAWRAGGGRGDELLGDALAEMDGELLDGGPPGDEREAHAEEFDTRHR